jgi:hypothetical protein
MGTDEAIGWLKVSVVMVMGSFMFLEGSGIFEYIGLGDVGWEGTMLSCGGDRVYGNDGACLVMTVENALASSSGSPVMLIIVWAA